MTRYVALFGSINVGGNRVTMADLRWAFEREGLTGLETVVASGNLLFEYDERPLDGLEDLFAHVMLDRFDIRSTAMVISEFDATFNDDRYQYLCEHSNQSILSLVGSR